MIIDIVPESVFVSDYIPSNADCNFLNSIRKFFLYLTENITTVNKILYNHNRFYYNNNSYDSVYVKINIDEVIDINCDLKYNLCIDLESFVRINKRRIYLNNEPKRLSEMSSPNETKFGYIYYTYITLLKRNIDTFKKNIFLNSVDDMNNINAYLIMQVHDFNLQDKYYVIKTYGNNTLNSIINGNALSINVLLPFLVTITDNFYLEYISY